MPSFSINSSEARPSPISRGSSQQTAVSPPVIPIRVKRN